jgi:hypothetical protein
MTCSTTATATTAYATPPTSPPCCTSTEPLSREDMPQRSTCVFTQHGEPPMPAPLLCCLLCRKLHGSIAYSRPLRHPTQTVPLVCRLGRQSAINVEPNKGAVLIGYDSIRRSYQRWDAQTVHNESKVGSQLCLPTYRSTSVTDPVRKLAVGVRSRSAVR